MALIACPECRKQISSSAAICPQCGFPNPSKNKSLGNTTTPTQPSLTKLDVSAQFSIIQIDTGDAYEAAKLILKHLNEFRSNNWTSGQAFARKDGINEYHIENKAEKAILRFDLRPTILRGISSVSLNMLTMMVSAPDCTEQKIEQLKKLNQQTKIYNHSSSESMPNFGPTTKLVLLIFFSLVFAIFIASLVSSYGLQTLLDAFFK